MKSAPEHPTRDVVHSSDEDYYKQRREVVTLCLCPPHHDFTFACGCLECCRKTEELKDFEKEIKSKMKQVWSYHHHWDATWDYCLHLSSAVAWTKGLLDLLHKNLEAVYKESGVPLTSNSVTEVEAAKLRINEMLVANKLLDRFPTDKPLQACEIKRGLHFYEKIKFKDEAHYLLKMIEEIEKEHEGAKKSVDALAHSSSINFIEEQIKLVEKLPVMKLLSKVEDLIPHVTPIAYYSKMFAKASNFITDTCQAMVKERWEFWRQYNEARPSEGRVEDHNLNGLGDTFKSLLDKVESFKNEWEKEYAPFLRRLECLF